MICAVCNKESKNLRVCPYCFTPYPSEPATGAGKRSTGRSQQPGGPTESGATQLIDQVRDRALGAWAFYRKQTQVVQFSVAGIVLVLFLWWATGDEPEVEPGVVPSQVIATPLERDDALALIKQTRETALVDVQQDEVFVSYPAATFPVLEEGQLALAQQFTSADEIVEGRKRRIYFYNPNGKLFAQADGVRGVVLVK